MFSPWFVWGGGKCVSVTVSDGYLHGVWQSRAGGGGAGTRKDGGSLREKGFASEGSVSHWSERHPSPPFAPGTSIHRFPRPSAFALRNSPSPCSPVSRPSYCPGTPTFRPALFENPVGDRCHSQSLVGNNCLALNRLIVIYLTKPTDCV